MLAGSIVAGNVIPAMAYTYTNSTASVENAELDETGSMETTVYAELGSEFLVKIPKALTLSGVEKKGAYTVSVEGDISGTETIKVVPDETFALSSTGLADVTASITQDKTSWSCSEILADSAVISNGLISASGITAGAWNGTFNFNVVLNHVHCYKEVITKEATCTENGKKTFTCTCGDSYTEEIPATGCVDDNSDSLCDVCGEIYYTPFTLTSSNYTDCGITREGDVVIPKTFVKDGTNYIVTSIGNSAFYKCISLTSIEIPDSVTSIGSNAFKKCTNLVSVDIPDGVTSIKNSTFYECKNLTNITIPDSVTNIGASAFYNSGLTSIEIPNSVVAINSQTFRFCRNLSSVIIPDSVTSMGDYAFAGCSSLSSITIPDSVTSIGSHVFEDCTNLISITVSEENSIYDSRNNCNAIIESSTNTLLYGCQNTVIPDSVTSIGEYAFSYCTNLTNISIPDSVTSISKYAFQHCTGLNSVGSKGSGASIEIPDTITSIDGDTFTYCTSLTSVEIPTNVTSIGGGAFASCYNLATVTIPASVTNIGGSAFYECKNLVTINYTGTEEQWNTITKGNYWNTTNGSSSVQIVYNYTE